MRLSEEWLVLLAAGLFSSVRAGTSPSVFQLQRLLPSLPTFFSPPAIEYDESSQAECVELPETLREKITLFSAGLEAEEISHDHCALYAARHGKKFALVVDEGCWPTDELPGPPLPPNRCSLPCGGNLQQSCGGQRAASVVPRSLMREHEELSMMKVATESSDDNCYSMRLFGGKFRLGKNYFLLWRNNSYENCKKKCTQSASGNFHFMGLAGGRKCYCLEEEPTKKTNGCTIPCSGNKSEMCGSWRAVTVVGISGSQIGAPTPSPTLTTSELVRTTTPHPAIKPAVPTSYPYHRSSFGPMGPTEMPASRGASEIVPTEFASVANVDCVVGDWGVWGECTATCGEGVRVRNRPVTVYPSGEGAPCPALNQTETCGNFACPVDCKLSEFGPWGECSVSCGVGERQRMRRIEAPTKAGGRPCPCESALIEISSCELPDCPTDCVVTGWSEWSACSATCGTGQKHKTRMIRQKELNGGRTCPAESELFDAIECNEKDCPIDCKMSEWQPWTPCDAECGEGTRSRRREVTVEPTAGGKKCGLVEENEACPGLPPCPVDCEVGEWSEWSSCSATCGDKGVRFQTQSVTQKAEHGGEACPPLQKKVGECEPLDPCPVDCEVTGWGPWESCSASCGGGSQKRHKEIVRKAEGAGEPCPLPAGLSESRPCNQDPCPVDCQMSPWEPWGECSVSCGEGTQERSRKVLVEAAAGGAACEEVIGQRECSERECYVPKCIYSEWTEWGECVYSHNGGCGNGGKYRNRLVLEDPPGLHCGASVAEYESCPDLPCPVDCDMSAWSNWGECSATCGVGTWDRSRTVKVEPAHGGKGCSTILSQTSPCEGLRPCPIDCRLGEWSDWGECDSECGEGMRERRRDRAIAAAFGGKECTDPLKEVEPCPDLSPCPVDCEMSDWGSWSQCDSTCGVGYQDRRRRVKTPAAHQGAPCPTELTQRQECPDLPACPVDCELSEWGCWGSCPVECGTGKHSRERHVLVEAANGGKECDTKLTEERECESVPCPIDCEMSDWSEWGGCSISCGTGGMRLRNREVTVVPLHGGKACDSRLEEEGPCEELPGCPVDCLVSCWSKWGECSVTCGGGTKKRSKVILVEPQNGGKECPEEATLEDTVACNERPCPVDCVMGEWESWDDVACSARCGVGTQTRKRSVVSPAKHGGFPCSDEREQTQECDQGPCPVDCEMTPWSAWGECSKSCGVGQRNRHRDVVVDAAHGGEECPADTIGSEDCKLRDCPIDCEVSEWQDFSDCSASCGPGTHSRSRSVTTQAAFAGIPCPQLEETKACKLRECPIDCVMEAWSAWGCCSSDCGPGEQARTRGVLSYPKFGGAKCDEHVIEKMTCQAPPCPIDCKLSEWSEWAPCSSSCGVGSQSRNRQIVQHPAHMGEPCNPNLVEERECKDVDCPIDCEVSPPGPWGECSLSCGGGKQQQTKEILVEALYGGKACPAAAELITTRSCNVDPCPVDCVMTDWGDWGECSAECGEGTKRRTREIATEPEHNGVACPPEMEETKPCQAESPCPIDCTLTPWSSWADCTVTCGHGTRQRTRQIDQTALHGGEECPAELTQLESCCRPACPVPCLVSEWREWGDCSASCDGGTQTRRREIILKAQHGGDACPPSAEMVDTQMCNPEPCPVPCQVSEWGAFDECTATCGRGSRTRQKKILAEAQNGGEACPTDDALTQTVPCKDRDCPIDCVFSSWTEWSDCNSACGEGSRVRYREIETPSKHGGKPCIELGLLVDEERCEAETKCPIHCEVGEWSEWGPCSATCGAGLHMRARLVNVEAEYGGNECPANLEETETCFETVCPVDCQLAAWSVWSDCSATCGIGSMKRKRFVLREATPGGEDCPPDAPLEETSQCQYEACPTAPPEGNTTTEYSWFPTEVPTPTTTTTEAPTTTTENEDDLTPTAPPQNATTTVAATEEGTGGGTEVPTTDPCADLEGDDGGWTTQWWKDKTYPIVQPCIQDLIILCFLIAAFLMTCCCCCCCACALHHKGSSHQHSGRTNGGGYTGIGGPPDTDDIDVGNT
uniref:WSC domain-containing protein n=1 Tax=Chromera velia CCMP2878 TaxID=1169474 RepID=A0A0G4F982_9ALVE|eukprot:Cvel_15849.t1-p1 / transcript=Cvel_15849.t1 / gene=Cvel_15849 / organism=Chromera_velia_CCMP2878 / gene_product=SCO-spondin, putative / transcript_product=SCO-spondin, putative / location=Cvel_scaffold1193:32983-52940(+) / protein_length=2026 / sequence_SO=supercontig / SO=protein_coding / is_pseudo=false